MSKIVSIAIAFFIVFHVNAQQADNEILIKIDDKKITKNEFLRLYNKNKTNITTGEVTSLDDYLKLFVNFQLKIAEAEKLGYDTLSSFKQEFKGYRDQLARPYLIDKEVNDEIIKEAYERMLYEVRASHIHIEIMPDALPEDTMLAYEKAIALRNRVINGEPFEYVAKGASDDKSVKYNSGDLGYFSVFEMVYPFENAVYTMNVGDISMPVRTQFGYHIIKKTDVRESIGQIKVAHIMLLTPQGIVSSDEQTKKGQIDHLYHRLMKGEDFTELAKEYSEDRGSARNGGELPWFGAGKMVPEFEKVAFDLKSNGSISQPVKTGFGWHIIKRIDKKDIGSFEEMEAEIKYKAGKDQRIEIARTALVDRLKYENGFKLKDSNVPYYDDTLNNKLIINAKYLNKYQKFNDTLFSYMGKVVREKEFKDYLNILSNNTELKAEQIKPAFNQFVEGKILETEDKLLESKYPEFKYTVKEYYDGILYFEITDNKVWSKALSDSIGVFNFYNENKQNYFWDEKYDGSVYYCSDKKILKKVLKITGKRSFGKKVTNDELLKKISTDGSEQLKIVSNVFTKGENEFVDFYVWITGKPKGTDLVFVKGREIPKSQKSFDEAKGQVISDYQDYIEKSWTEELHRKYKVEINQNILSKIR